jgi:hypothetical protein
LGNVSFSDELDKALSGYWYDIAFPILFKSRTGDAMPPS